MTSPMKGTGTKIVIEWIPDKNSPIPLYQQIVDYISGKIAAGDYTTGTKLPSQRDMALQFGVNRSTIVTAMEELLSYGVIESHAAHGTRVADTLWSPKHRQSPPNWSFYVKQGTAAANAIAVQQLNHYESSSEFLQFSTGQLAADVLPMQLLTQAMNSAVRHTPELSYLQPQGLPKLRAILSQRLHCRRGIDAPESCILLTNGQTETMDLICRCLLKPGSSIYTEQYSWLFRQNYLTAAGMKLKPVPIDDEGLCYWRIRLDPQTDTSPLLYTMPNFHTPTTQVMSAARRRQLLGFCQSRQLPIIENDVYANLWLTQPPPPPLKSMDSCGTVLYVSSLNKEFSPALGLGFLVAPESVVERLADMKRQTTDLPSFYSQWTLAYLLESHLYDDYLLHVRRRLIERRDRMLELLQKYFTDLATWSIPQGGYFLWLEFDDDLPIQQLFQKALEQKILICPGSLFSAERSHCLRLSFSYVAESDMERGLRTLSQIACRLKKKR